MTIWRPPPLPQPEEVLENHTTPKSFLDVTVKMGLKPGRFY
jgi:hypothetical protein